MRDELFSGLSNELKERGTDKKLFSDEVKAKNVHWTKPETVVQISFTEWNEDGKLKYLGFISLRKNKKPKNVRKE